MKLVITGAHFSPSLAVIKQLPKGTDILYVGRKHALEGDSAIALEFKTLKELNIPFKEINTGRFQRTFGRHSVSSFFKLPAGFVESYKILNTYKPDAVLSFGGYISLPVVIAASFLGIPVVIHEQTLEAGVANKIAARFARKVCISFETSRRFFPSSKIVMTGNPVREEFKIKSSKFKVNSSVPTIYITGGSLGSHTINVLIEGCIHKLLEHYTVIHQTGDAKEYGDFERLSTIKEKFPEELSKRYILKKFVDPSDVPSVLKKADLVVSRAGINTVTELIAFSKPALLIPLPFTQANEQLKNALYFKSLGLGEVAQQNDLSSQKLYELIQKMITDKNQYKKIKTVQQIPDPAQKIIEVVEKEIETHKQ